MNAGLMIASILLGIGLVRVEPFAALACGAATIWFAIRMKTMDETRFLGLLFFVAILGVLAEWLTGLAQFFR